MTKTVKELAADIEGLRGTLEKMVEYNSQLMDTISTYRDQIASLQAADLVLVESIKTITTFLAIDQQPAIRDILAGYQ